MDPLHALPQRRHAGHRWNHPGRSEHYGVKRLLEELAEDLRTSRWRPVPSLRMLTGITLQFARAPAFAKLAGTTPWRHPAGRPRAIASVEAKTEP